jgi:hypothetical protein
MSSRASTVNSFRGSNEFLDKDDRSTFDSYQSSSEREGHNSLGDGKEIYEGMDRDYDPGPRPKLQKPLDPQPLKHVQETGERHLRKKGVRHRALTDQQKQVLRDRRREIQRMAILQYLKGDGNLQDEDTRQLHDLEQSRLLWEIASEYQTKGSFCFNRFERLSLVNILHQQHALVELDEKIQYRRNGILSKRLRNKLQRDLVEYGISFISIAINIFINISDYY